MIFAPLSPTPICPTPTAIRVETPVIDARVLLAELAELLSKLDCEKECLERAGFAPEPQPGLQILAGIVERIVAFGDTWFDAKDYPDRLVDVLREYYAAASVLRTTVRRKRFWGLIAGSDFESQRGNIVGLLNHFHKLIFLYFEFFTSRISDRTLAREWVESAAVFGVDVRRVLRSFRLTEKQQTEEHLPCRITRFWSSMIRRRS